MDSQVIVSPEQREFFQRWPLPWGAATKVAHALGYRAATVSSWTTGHSRMPRAAFPFLLTELEKAGMRPDPEAVELVYMGTTDATPKKMKPVPHAVLPAEPIEIGTFEKLEWLLRNTPLSEFQQLQLTRVLLT